MNFKVILVYLLLTVYFIIFLVTGSIPGGKISRHILYRNENPTGYWIHMALFAMGIVFVMTLASSHRFQDFFFKYLLKYQKTRSLKET